MASSASTLEIEAREYVQTPPYPLLIEASFALVRPRKEQPEEFLNPTRALALVSRIRPSARDSLCVPIWPPV
jgi:hypothetical protein